MQPINYNHLHYFWVIAKEGGVTAACKKLSLTQPTLSAQLKQFENGIGQLLFERKSRKLILNDVGKTVFDYADTIFKTGQALVNTLGDHSVKNNITVNIGVQATLPKKNVHHILRVALSHSKVITNITTGDLSSLFTLLTNHQLDMVVSSKKPSSDIKGLETRVIERTPVVFVGASEFKNLRRAFPQSLNGQKMYLPSPQSDFRTELETFFKKNNIQPQMKGEIQDTELLRVIAAGGDGIVAIVRSAVSDLIKAKELYVLGEILDVYKEIYLITAERKTAHPIVAEIIKRHEG